MSCIQAANDACNAIALCYLAAACGGVGPSGTATCAATATCEGNCNIANPTVACGCACIQAMSPSTAFDLVLNNECANYTTCPSCNPASFNGTECDQCAYACTSTDACASN